MKKRIALILLAFIVVAPVAFIGLSVVNSKDCSQLVIDTYEIHSGIDIPQVESINCYFDGKKNVRLSIYSMKGLVYLDRYIQKYKFEPVNLKELGFPVALSENEKPMGEKLYAASGTKWGNAWRYVLEKESNRLWVEIKY